MLINTITFYSTTFMGTPKTDTKKVLELLNKGYNDAQIARELGVSRQTIGSHRKKLGIKPKNMRSRINYDIFDRHQVKTLVEEGNSLNQISKVLGVTISTVRMVLKHFGLNTQQGHIASNIDKSKLVAMIDMGKSQKQIAKELGLDDVGALTPIIKKLRIKATKEKVNSITAEELEYAIDHDISVAELSKRYQVSPQYIFARLKELKLQTKEQKRQNVKVPKKYFCNDVKAGFSVNKLAKKYHIGTNRVMNLVQKYKLQIAPKQTFEDIYPIETVKDLVQNASSIREIAKALEISDKTAYKILKKYGLKISKPEPLWKILPHDEIIQAINEGQSVHQIAKIYRADDNDIYAFINNNGLKSPKKIYYENLPSKDDIQTAMNGINTEEELAQKLGIRKGTLNSLLTKYDLKLMPSYPLVEDISRILKDNPNASVDEISNELGYSGISVDKMISKTGFRIFHTLSFAKKSNEYNAYIINYFLEHGDSPLQIAEMFGVSSQKVQEMIIRLKNANYYDLRHINTNEAVKLKDSPTQNEIKTTIERLNNILSKSLLYNHNQYLADIAEELGVSPEYIEYAVKKYKLNEQIEKSGIKFYYDK